MKLVILFLIASIYYVSVNSLYLDDNSDEDSYEILQDRDLNRFNERDDSAINSERMTKTDKQEPPHYITIQADPAHLKSRVYLDKRCEFQDGIYGLQCEKKAHNGSECYLSKKIKCKTVHTKNMNNGTITSGCKCSLVEHVDKC